MFNPGGGGGGGGGGGWDSVPHNNDGGSRCTFKGVKFVDRYWLELSRYLLGALKVVNLKK